MSHILLCSEPSSSSGFFFSFFELFSLVPNLLPSAFLSTWKTDDKFYLSCRSQPSSRISLYLLMLGLSVFFLCVHACVRACVGRAVPAAQSSSAHARTPARPRPGLASCCLGNAMATPAGCLARLRFSPFSVEPKPVNLHARGRKRLCAACAHRCADTCARVCKRGVEWLSPPADPRAGPGLHTQPSARAQAGRVPCSGNAMVGPQSAGSVTPARMPAATPTNEAPQAQRTRGTRACPQ